MLVKEATKSNCVVLSPGHPQFRNVFDVIDNVYKPCIWSIFFKTFRDVARVLRRHKSLATWLFVQAKLYPNNNKKSKSLTICEENSAETDGFPSQIAINAERVHVITSS